MSKIPEWSKWLARNKSGKLFAYEKEPHKVNWLEVWSNHPETYDGKVMLIELEDITYPQVRWSDNKATEIKEKSGGVRKQVQCKSCNSIDLELPKLPKYVADWYESYLLQGGQIMDILGTLTPSIPGSISVADRDVYNWFKNNTTTLLKAIVLGEYEVEIEPIYRVRAVEAMNKEGF